MTLTTLTDQFSLDLKELNRKGHQYFLWYSLHFLLFQLCSSYYSNSALSEYQSNGIVIAVPLLTSSPCTI